MNLLNTAKMNAKELTIEIEKQKKKIRACQDTIKILERMIIAEQQNQGNHFNGDRNGNREIHQ